MAQAALRTRGRNASLDSFFARLDGVALLSADEEVDLARRIEAGRAAARRLEGLDRGAPGRLELAAGVADGEAAREQFVEANLRLVIHLAARHPRPRAVPLEDVVQDGTIGLVAAVDRFDWRRGYRFSTYATWWIRQAIQRGAGTTDRGIRLPYVLHEAGRRLAAARARLESETGTPPALAALADAAGLDERTARRALAVPPDAVSYDAPAGEVDDGSRLHELAVAADDDPAAEVVDRVTAERLLRLAADRLDDRAWRVLRLRYGLDGALPRTHDAVADAVGCSRETVRLTLNAALARLRQEAAGTADT